MTTIDTILEELKDVPANRLEELHSFIYSLKETEEQADEKHKKVLSFAGIFNDMSEDDFTDFTDEMKRTRNDLFNRDTDV